MLAGVGAARFAGEQGLARVDDPHNYYTRASSRLGKPSDLTHGTVGAVALDTHGALAAATSTGGVFNKRAGRVGDSPIIGAGTFADNASCAVSCTGVGEDFIRTSLARTAAFFVEFRAMQAEEAAREAIRYLVAKVNGQGGLILVDRLGGCARAHSTPGMLTAAFVGGVARVDAT